MFESTTSESESWREIPKLRRRKTEPTMPEALQRIPALSRKLSEAYIIDPTRKTYALALSTYNRILGDCPQCSLNLWCQNHSGFRLVSYEESEEYMRGNPYIVDGYRPPLPIDLCIKSLLSWNNETLNIWTHLFGLVLLFFLAIYDNFVTLPQIKGVDYADHVIYTATAVLSMICMLNSTLYHLLCCMSEVSNRFWLQMDLLGIVFVMLGMYLSGIYYAFYCHHELHNLYLSIFFVLGFCAVVALFHPKYTLPEFTMYRALLYSAVAAYGFIPTIHWVYINSIESEVTQRFLPRVAYVYGLSFVALCFYLTMFPERLFPGRCDKLGHSHQIWHVLILLALLHWRSSGFDVVQHTVSNGCPH